MSNQIIVLEITVVYLYTFLQESQRTTHDLQSARQTDFSSKYDSTLICTAMHSNTHTHLYTMTNTHTHFYVFICVFHLLWVTPVQQTEMQL